MAEGVYVVGKPNKRMIAGRCKKDESPMIPFPSRKYGTRLYTSAHEKMRLRRMFPHQEELTAPSLFTVKLCPHQKTNNDSSFQPSRASSKSSSVAPDTPRFARYSCNSSGRSSIPA